MSKPKSSQKIPRMSPLTSIRITIETRKSPRKNIRTRNPSINLKIRIRDHIHNTLFFPQQHQTSTKTNSINCKNINKPQLLHKKHSIPFLQLSFQKKQNIRIMGIHQGKERIQRSGVPYPLNVPDKDFH